MLKVRQQRLPPYVEQEMPDGHAGFRKGRPNSKHLLGTVKPFFNSMDHEGLQVALKEMGVRQQSTDLKCNREWQEGTVRTQYEETEQFRIGKHVRRGCISSPYWFNPYAEHTI